VTAEPKLLAQALSALREADDNLFVYAMTGGSAAAVEPARRFIFRASQEVQGVKPEPDPLFTWADPSDPVPPQPGPVVHAQPTPVVPDPIAPDPMPPPSAPSEDVPPEKDPGPITMECELKPVPRWRRVDGAWNTKRANGSAITHPHSEALDNAIPGDHLRLVTPEDGSAYPLLSIGGGDLVSHPQVAAWKGGERITNIAVSGDPDNRPKVRGIDLRSEFGGFDDVLLLALHVMCPAGRRAPIMGFKNSHKAGMLRVYRCKTDGESPTGWNQSPTQWGLLRGYEMEGLDLRGNEICGADEHKVYVDAIGWSGRYSPSIVYVDNTDTAPSGRTHFQHECRVYNDYWKLRGRAGGGIAVLAGNKIITRKGHGGAAFTFAGFLGKVRILPTNWVDTDMGVLVAWAERSNANPLGVAVRDANGYSVSEIEVRGLLVEAEATHNTCVQLSAVGKATFSEGCRLRSTTHPAIDMPEWADTDRVGELVLDVPHPAAQDPMWMANGKIRRKGQMLSATQINALGLQQPQPAP
jgi:hypothetical protein